MKIRKIEKPKGQQTIKMKTRADDGLGGSVLPEWWKAEDEATLARDVVAAANYLKTVQQYRIRQRAVDIRLYCGMSVYSYAGSNVSKMDKTKSLPDDKPSFNLIGACVDTLVSRLTQTDRVPKFLTDGADYRQRRLSQELNQFTQGEFYQTRAYEKATKMVRDGATMGPGHLKVYEDDDRRRVAVDRVMNTDLYVDDNDALNGNPESLIQLGLIPRSRLLARNPKKAAMIEKTPQSYPDNSSDSGRTLTDQVMIVEAWKRASGPDSEADGYVPGRHVIATSAGIILDEPEWKKDRFPFVFFNYSDPFLGFWGQGISTQLFGTQITLNRIMNTIARAITLVGVPRVFIDSGSKVVNAHNNNEVGVIVKYQGVKPSYEVAPCNAPELYAERDKLIEYGFRQTGVSSMQASSEKPVGLNSGEAIRSYDDISSDRFAKVSKKVDQIFIDLSYLIVDTAMDIAKRDGKYQTVYPSKDGTKKIDLPKMDLLKNPFVIQCFNESSLPRQPAGRIEKVTEMVQSGMLTIKEGRRLIRPPEDLEQNEKLDLAPEERIFQILDKIVEEGVYTPPDEYMDLAAAKELSLKYINLYLAAKLEEEKADMLRQFYTETQGIIDRAAAGAAPLAGAPGAAGAAPTPTAVPQPAPVSPFLPNKPQSTAA